MNNPPNSALTPQVFLSHLFVVLDQNTYDALMQTSDVAALAAVEQKSVVAESSSWTGFYIRGRQTYIEFFNSANAPTGLRLDDSGLALTVEESGGVARVAARWRPAFGEKVEVGDTTRSTLSGPIPWFTAVAVHASAPSALETWVMEFDPNYLAKMHAGSTIAHPLTRQQYLSWDYLPTRPLEEVVGATVALNASENEQLATELELIGWHVDRNAGGFMATGPDFNLVATVATGRAGIREIKLRLHRAVAKRELRLGSARLILEGRAARFAFWQ